MTNSVLIAVMSIGQRNARDNGVWLANGGGGQHNGVVTHLSSVNKPSAKNDVTWQPANHRRVLTNDD